MTAPTHPSGGATAPFAQRDVPRADVVLAMAMMLSGLMVALLVDARFWVITPTLVAMVLYASVRRAPAAAAGSVDELAGFPEGLRATVDMTLSSLPGGSARELLGAVLRQARGVFGAGESSFDAQEERTVRRSVEELVDSACIIAGDLARLDGAIPAARTSGGVQQRAIETRELLARQMGDAASSLAALVASGMTGGTPASERVGELVARIRSDATARRAAKDELESSP